METPLSAETNKIFEVCPRCASNLVMSAARALITSHVSRFRILLMGKVKTLCSMGYEQ
jgi:hypothetical protein